jgi:hypothetical protein
MNKFVKDMLMAQSRRSGGRDERNPYGSRGGYVTSRSPRRDRDMDDYGMPKGDYRRYGGAMPPMRDYNDYDMRGDMRGRDYGDYEMHDMRGRDYADYGMDYGMRDYGEMEYGKMSHKDIENWKRHMKNQDGTMGEHFKKEQVMQAARQIGVNPEEYGEHIFPLVMNMMYSDYCAVAKKFGLDRPDFYAEMAKAFLNDKDFSGEPEEKVWLYYQCIAAPEQE